MIRNKIPPALSLPSLDEINFEQELSLFFMEQLKRPPVRSSKSGAPIINLKRKMLTHEKQFSVSRVFSGIKVVKYTLRI